MSRILLVAMLLAAIMSLGIPEVSEAACSPSFSLGSDSVQTNLPNPPGGTATSSSQVRGYFWPYDWVCVNGKQEVTTTQTVDYVRWCLQWWTYMDDWDEPYPTGDPDVHAGGFCYNCTGGNYQSTESWLTTPWPGKWWVNVARGDNENQVTEGQWQWNPETEAEWIWIP